jgi:uncharacterized membrane protein
MTAIDNTALEGRAGASPRLPVIDIARGLAVVAMVIYHGAWDVSTLALADLDVSGSRGWNLFARSIAASFLVLAGIGLALAHRGGIRWPHFLRRLAVIAAAAAAITVATYYVFPRSFIFFGILHNMVVSSVLALPFVLLSPALAAIASLVVLGLPHLVVGGGLLDDPALAFLGLGRVPPFTNDWVPIFPWTGYVLAGIAMAPLVSGMPWRGQGGTLGRTLTTLGRHSLVIYLLHQPLLFGAALGLREILGPNQAAEAAPFMRQCARSCQDQGQGEALCLRTCGCTVEALRRDGIWNAIREGSPSGEFVQRAGNRAAECLKRESGS